MGSPPPLGNTENPPLPAPPGLGLQNASGFDLGGLGDPLGPVGGLLHEGVDLGDEGLAAVEAIAAAPSRSALFTTITSATSTNPDFSPWMESPSPGACTTTTAQFFADILNS